MALKEQLLVGYVQNGIPGEVSVIRIRWLQQDGTPYLFDASQGPGYVWHCHIVDHEDNEMMRPYEVLP